MHWLTFSTTASLGAWGVATMETDSHAKSLLWCFVAAYLLCDLWLWSLHCFMDRVENLKYNSIFTAVIQPNAVEFQEHHDFPVNVLHENHVGSTNDTVLGTTVLGLMLGPWSSPYIKVTTMMFIFIGSIAAANHYYCHARTYRFKIPAFYTVCQDIGLLPSAKFHKIHHTAPHEENWSFLIGFGFVYEWMHNVCGATYSGAAVPFIASNPLVLELLFFGSHQLATQFA